MPHNDFSSDTPGGGARRTGRTDRSVRRPSDKPSDKPFKKERTSVSLISDIDKEILRLIARRTRLRDELPKGRDATRSERELRFAWETHAARLSRDPLLIRQVFALLQQVECAQHPKETDGQQDVFNLNPSRSPVSVSLKGLSDDRRSRILGTMSAATGCQNVLRDIMINDSLVELVKAFNQISPCLRWEEDGRLVSVADSKSLGSEKALLDRAVHIGDDMLNFLLLLCVMAVRPCRLKLMGGSSLKLADFSSLRHFLPTLGARFTSIVPGQDGLPARLEASGMLPDQVIIPATLSRDAAMAVCIGLFCAPRTHSIRVSLEHHGNAEYILKEFKHILETGHHVPNIDGNILFLAPDPRPSLIFPDDTQLYMDLAVASTVLALPACIGGKVDVEGGWATIFGGEDACKTLLEATGITVTRTAHGMATSGEPMRDFDNKRFAAVEDKLPERLRPLAVLFPALAVLRGGKGYLPSCALLEKLEVVDEFLERLGLERDGQELRPVAEMDDAMPWSSPSAIWGATLALAAFQKPNLKLLNPGIVIERMPGFWQWYNGLPNPALHSPPAPHVAASVEVQQPPRRRIRAGYLPDDQLPPPVQDPEE